MPHCLPLVCGHASIWICSNFTYASGKGHSSIAPAVRFVLVQMMAYATVMQQVTTGTVTKPQLLRRAARLKTTLECT